MSRNKRADLIFDLVLGTVVLIAIGAILWAVYVALGGPNS